MARCLPALALCAVLSSGLLLAANGQILSGLVSVDVVPAGFALQKSVSFQDLGDPPSGDPFELNATDPLVAPPAGVTAYTPDQIHLQLAEGSPTSGSFWLTWSTGFYSFYQNQESPSYPTSTIYAPQTPDPASVSSVVKWGLTAGGPYPFTAGGYATAYVQTYLHFGPTFVSELLHHVQVTGVPYGVTIYYKVGDPAKELSAEFNTTLRTSIRPQTYTYPMRLGVVADIGQTLNSSVTYQHLVTDNPDAACFIGDLSYADDYNDQGGDTSRTPTLPASMLATFANTSKTLGQTYQPRWQTMGRLLQRAGGGTSIPWLFGPGNHEIERDEFLRPFQSYTNRYRSPYEQSYSRDPLYFSLDVGPAHIVMLNGYDGYLPNTTIETTVNGQSQLFYGNSNGPSFESGNYPLSQLGAAQFSWLLNDLARINRAVTPWVIVTWHQPVYNTYSTHFKEVDCLREQIEPFLYNAGVDIILHGHVHAYERTFQTVNYTLDGCAPRWLTMGDGGNIEGLYRQFAGTNCQCPAGTSSNICPCANVTAQTAPQYCTTFQNGLFAPINGTQPPFSAYREPSFGHGIIDFMNDTHALWTWNRNQDGQAVITDSVYFVKNPACPNQKPGTPVLAPSTAPPATTLAPATPPAAPAAHPDPFAPIHTAIDDVHAGIGSAINTATGGLTSAIGSSG